MTLARKHGNSGSRSESRGVEPLNNNGENRVASITFNDLFAATHHL